MAFDLMEVVPTTFTSQEYPAAGRKMASYNLILNFFESELRRFNSVAGV
jgi:hypothetical protein